MRAMRRVVTCPTCGADVLGGSYCTVSPECRATATMLQVREDMLRRRVLGLPMTREPVTA